MREAQQELLWVSSRGAPDSGCPDEDPSTGMPLSFTPSPCLPFIPPIQHSSPSTLTGLIPSNIHPSTHPTVHSPTNPPLCPPTYLSPHSLSFIYLPSIHRNHTPVHSSTHDSVTGFIHPSITTPTHTPILHTPAHSLTPPSPHLLPYPPVTRPQSSLHSSIYPPSSHKSHSYSFVYFLTCSYIPSLHLLPTDAPPGSYSLLQMYHPLPHPSIHLVFARSCVLSLNTFRTPTTLQTLQVMLRAKRGIKSPVLLLKRSSYK